MNGQDLLAWDVPAAGVGPWLYHAPLLFSLLHQLDPANVLVICDADSDLPALLRALPDTLASATPIATILLDLPPAPNSAVPPDETADPAVTSTPDPQELPDMLKAQLEIYPDRIFNLVLIDLPLSEGLVATIQGEALARVSQQAALVGLHGAERAPAGDQLATRIRLTRPHLSNVDGAGLLVFSTADDPQPTDRLVERLGMLRTLGRAYSGVAIARQQSRDEATAHDATLTQLRNRQSLLEETNKAQTGQLLEQAARISDTSRALAALPVDTHAQTVQAARTAIDELRDKPRGGVDVPAGLVRLLDLIEDMRRQLDESRASRDQAVTDGQTLVAQLRVKEAELLKGSHATSRMTEELAALARVVQASRADKEKLRGYETRTAKLETENSKLKTKLAEAGAKQQKLQKQIEEFLHSTSWRISAPVRAVGKVLRRR